MLLAAPALMRFLVWPLALHYARAIPPFFLVLIGLVILPFLMLRALHRLLRLASS